MAAPRNPKFGGLAPVPVDDLLEVEFPPREFLAYPLIPRKSLIFLSGDPKLGKTWIAMDLAYAGAAGKDFLGTYKISKPFRTLFLEAEAPDDLMMKMRWKMLKLGRRYGNTGDRLINATGLFQDADGLDEKGFQALENMIKKFRPDLVVLDAWKDFALGDLNSQKEMMPFIHKVQRLIRMHGVSVIVVHHNNKGSGNTGYSESEHRMSGTIMQWASSDVTLVCYANGGASDQMKVKVSLRWSHADEMFAVVRRRDPEDTEEPERVWHEQVELSLKMPPINVQVVVDILEESDMLSSTVLKESVMEKTGRNEKAAQEAMKEAVEKGRVFKAKDLNDKRVTIYRLEEDPF